VTWYTGNRASAGDVFDRSLLLATARIGLGISLEVLPWWAPEHEFIPAKCSSTTGPFACWARLLAREIGLR